MNVAISIGILAASIVALTLVDQSKLWSAVSALGALSLGLLAVSAAMETISKVSGVKGSASMLGIAASLLILVKTLKSMEGLDHEQIWQNIGILGVMASGLAIVAGLLGKFAPQLSKGAITLIGISVALRIMVGVLKDIDSLTLDNIGRSIKILIGAMGGLVALAIICKNIKMGSAVGILAMVVALKLFVGVFDDIINLDAAKIKNSMDTLITIFGAFAALMISSKFAGANAAKGGIGILAISAALLLLTGTIKILAKIDNGDLKKGTNAIAKILTLFAGVIAASNFAGKNAAKAGVGLLAMSGAILLLSGAIIILSHIKSDGLDQALKAIAKLELLFAGLIVATHFAKDCKSTLVIISATIGLLAVAIGTLSMINQENLASATNALSQVMLVFSILITSTHLAKKANGTLIIMVGAVTILAGIIALLSGLPAESVLGVSTALSTLLLSLSASMFIISNTGRMPVRNIVISLAFLWKNSIEDVRQLSYKYFPIKKPLTLTIETDNRIAEIQGYVESNDPNIFSSSEGSDISIICPNPFFYSAGEKKATIFSGVEAMFEFPFCNDSLTEALLEMGAIQHQTEKVVVYNGDAEIGVVIKIHAVGEATNIAIFNTGTREVFRLNTDKMKTLTGSVIIDGDDIIINTVKGQKSITLQRAGKTTNILNCMEKGSDWFQLAKGDNVFAYTAETGSTNLQFKIENQIAYEGV